MPQHSWMIEVLSDLEQYAKLNQIGELEPRLSQALIVAKSMLQTEAQPGFPQDDFTEPKCVFSTGSTEVATLGALIPPEKE